MIDLGCHQRKKDILDALQIKDRKWAVAFGLFKEKDIFNPSLSPFSLIILMNKSRWIFLFSGVTFKRRFLSTHLSKDLDHSLKWIMYLKNVKSSNSDKKFFFFASLSRNTSFLSAFFLFRRVSKYIYETSRSTPLRPKTETGLNSALGSSLVLVVFKVKPS